MSISAIEIDSNNVSAKLTLRNLLYLFAELYVAQFNSSNRLVCTGLRSSLLSFAVCSFKEEALASMYAGSIDRIVTNT